MAVIDLGLELPTRDNTCIDYVGAVDPNSPSAKVAHAIPSAEFDPQSAVIPFDLEGHGSHGTHAKTAC
ncbi:MAG: hypothetical protein OXG34_06305 [bacterium]|nr:hypothetical protein [bacterium]